jgi:dipeptidyl aminopeptidase/acylaminoacyl peptidase
VQTTGAAESVVSPGRIGDGTDAHCAPLIEVFVREEPQVTKWLPTFDALTLATCIAGVLLASCAPAEDGATPAGVIVVSADQQGALSGEIYRVDLDGHRTNLSRSPFQDTQPRVSPDGKQIAFVSDRTGHDVVYVVAVDGRGLERVSGELAQPRLIGWSRGGDLAIESGRSDTPTVGLLDILSPARHEHWRVRQPGSIVGAAWSPDGREIAFLTPKGVRIVSNRGAPMFQVRGRGLDFAWSPAGRLAVVAADVIRVFGLDGRLLALRLPSGRAA